MVIRICIISTVDVTLEKFVIPSARLMKERGFDVTLLASMTDKFINEFSKEFHLINIQMDRGAKPMGMIKSVMSFFRIFKKENFDMIQYATPNAAFYASIAGSLCHIQARVYCQWGIRYVGFSGIKRTLFRIIEKVTCNFSTHIRPASRKNMQFASFENLYNPIKASVVGDGGAVGIDLNVFDAEKREDNKNQIYNIYPQLKGKLVFGFVGRIDKDKGVNELIEAFKLFNQDVKDAFLLIIGPEEVREGLHDNLIEYSKECENIIFAGLTNEVQKYLSVLSILVHPSYREGFSMVIQQAMAMCVPVITTDIPGPSEVIEENISGILVPSKDSISLYMAMKSLVYDKKKQSFFMENGLIRVKKLFTQERMSELIVKDRQEIFHSIKN